MVCVVCSCCATSPYREVCRAKGGIGSGETLCHDIYPARPITVTFVRCCCCCVTYNATSLESISNINTHTLSKFSIHATTLSDRCSLNATIVSVRVQTRMLTACDAVTELSLRVVYKAVQFKDNGYTVLLLL